MEKLIVCLRWIGAVVLPVIAMSVAKLVWTVVNNITLYHAPGDLVDIISLNIGRPMFEMFVVPYVVAYVAPTHKKKAAMAITAFYVVLAIAIEAFAIGRGYFQARQMFWLVALIAGGVLGVYFCDIDENN